MDRIGRRVQAQRAEPIPRVTKVTDAGLLGGPFGRIALDFFDELIEAVAILLDEGLVVAARDLPAPREWGERVYDVRRWTVMPRGGHFAALEEPELLAQDIREFFRPLRRADA